MTALTYAIVGGVTVFAALVGLGLAWRAGAPRPPVTDLRRRQLEAERARNGVHDWRPRT